MCTKPMKSRCLRRLWLKFEWQYTAYALNQFRAHMANLNICSTANNHELDLKTVSKPGRTKKMVRPCLTLWWTQPLYRIIGHLSSDIWNLHNIAWLHSIVTMTDCWEFTGPGLLTQIITNRDWEQGENSPLQNILACCLREVKQHQNQDSKVLSRSLRPRAVA